VLPAHVVNPTHCTDDFRRTGARAYRRSASQAAQNRLEKNPNHRAELDLDLGRRDRDARRSSSDGARGKISSAKTVQNDKNSVSFAKGNLKAMPPFVYTH
jgi:hypothetical protein